MTVVTCFGGLSILPEVLKTDLLRKKTLFEKIGLVSSIPWF